MLFAACFCMCVECVTCLLRLKMLMSLRQNWLCLENILPYREYAGWCIASALQTCSPFCSASRSERYVNFSVDMFVMQLKCVKFILCYGNSVHLSSSCAPCGLWEYCTHDSFVDFGAVYIVCLFSSYAAPLILFFHFFLIFSFENRPAPFPGLRS